MPTTTITPVSETIFEVKIYTVEPDLAALAAQAAASAATATNAANIAGAAASDAESSANEAEQSAIDAAISATEAAEAKAIFNGYITSTAYSPTAPELARSGYWTTQTVGTFTNIGGLVVSSADLATNKEIRLYYNKTTNTYSKVLQGQDLGGYVANSDIYYRKNLFDKNSVISGYYIENTSGNLTANATSSVSDVIPIGSATSFFLSGRNTASVTGFRFLSESLTPMKPLASPGGAALATYGSGPLNGIYYAPSGAMYVQFTVRFVGVGTYDSIQLEEGVFQTAYESYDTVEIKPELLPPSSTPTPIFTLNKYSNTITVSSDLAVGYPVAATWVQDSARNNLWSPTQVLVNSLLIDSQSDDNCPVNIAGMYIGGNHGSTGNKRVTVTAHGKTLADVGSTWTDSAGTIWYLLKIINANTLYLHSANIGTSSAWSFKSTISGTLTHLSSASNTVSIVVGSFVMEQLYPCNIITKTGFFLDDVEITTDGVRTGSKLVLVENYNVVDVPSMLALLQSNRPVGGYVTQPDFRFGDSYLTVKNTYTFGKGCIYTLQTDFIARKSLVISYFGGTQHGYYKPTFTTALRRYIPYALPISDGTTTYDFRSKINLVTTTWVTDMNLTSAYWEGSVAPIRSVDIHEGTLNVNYNLGVLPVGVGQDRSNYINNAWGVWVSKKNYPFAFDSKVHIGGVIPANTILQSVVFRGYSVRDSSRTNYFIAKAGLHYYIMLDWHTSGIDQVPIPSEIQGRSFEVVNKTSNIVILGSILGSVLEVQISASTPMCASMMMKVL